MDSGQVHAEVSLGREVNMDKVHQGSWSKLWMGEATSP